MCCTKFFISGLYINGIYYLDVICFMLFAWCFLSIIIYRFKFENTIGKIKKSTFYYPILAFLIMTIFEMFFSFIRYHQPILSVLKMSYFHFVLVVYFILTVLVDSKEKLDDFKYMLVLFCTLCNIFQIIHVVMYSSSWNPYFYLTMLSFPLVMANALMGKNKIQTSLNLLTTIICVFFVGTNTAIRIAFIIVFITTILMHVIKKTKSNKFLIKGIIFFIISVCVVGGFVGTYVEKMVNSAVGNQVRVYAMEYYLDQFLQNPLLGMGFIDPNVNKNFYTLVHGKVSPLGGMSQYYIEDVGVVGYIAQFGLIGIVVLVFILIKLYKLIKSCDGIMLVESVGLLGLLFVMFVSLMPTNKAPIQMLPIFLMIMEKNAQISIKTGND